MRTQIPQKVNVFTRALRTIVPGVFAVFASALLAIALTFITPQKTTAATSSTINFQARLETSGGAIATDGAYNVTFHLFNSSTAVGGTSTDTGCGTDTSCEWTEQYTYNSGPGSTDARIQVKNGYLTINLGSITAFPGTINWTQQQWLTMDIGGTVGSGTITWDGQMSPRLLMTASPYAFQAGVLSTTDGSGNVGSLSFGAVTANPSITLPNTSGTVCLQSSGSCGFATGSGSAFIQGGNSFAAQAVLGTSDNNTLAFRTNGTNRVVIDASATTNVTLQQASNILVASAATGTNLTIQGGAATSGTNAGGNLLLQGGAGASTGASGSVIVKSNTNNSTTAFQVQNASGANLFTADTTNGNLILGNDGTPAVLTVRGGAATGNNVAGSTITVDASNGTGAGGSGDLIFRTAGAAANSNVTLDATSSGNTGFVSALNFSWSHTTTSTGSNVILIVGVSIQDQNKTVSSISYNGSTAGWTKLTNIACPTAEFNPSCEAELWYLKNPASGTNTIQVNLSGSAAASAGAATYYNVDQTTPFGTPATNSGGVSGSFSTSLNVSTTSSLQLVLDAIAIDNSGSHSPNSGQTQVWGDSQNKSFASTKAGTGSTVNMSWTLNSSDWADIGVAINPVSNSTADSLTDRLHITAAGNVGINNSSPQYTLDVGGTGQITANSTSAFHVQQSAGLNVLTVDTTNKRVIIGSGVTGQSSPAVLVVDSKTGSGDPTCTTGAIYYNASSGNNEFRACRNGTWYNLIAGVDVQTFTSNGTWTAPAGISTVVVIACGGGGSGGGGDGNATTTVVRQGGTGGGGGAYVERIMSAADAGASQSVTIGAQVNGGNGGSGASGSAGSAGNSSSFGTLVVAQGGGKGGGGPSTAANDAGGSGGGIGAAGAAGGGTSATVGGDNTLNTTNGIGWAGGFGGTSAGGSGEMGGAGGGGSSSAAAAGSAGGSSVYGGAGGAGGGGDNASNTATGGGGGGNTGTVTAGGGGSAGGNTGGAGGAGAAGNSVHCGTGGGGGGASNATTGGKGGDGGTPGGGGGGGGGGTSVGGAGGAGAAGKVWVFSW